jgi:hypothetical protein
MALQPIVGGLYVPKPPPTSDPAFGTIALSGSGAKVAYIFRAPTTGTLDKIEFKLDGVTTAQDIKVSFQDVDLGTGFPDGTADQFRVIASANVAAGWMVPGLMTSDGTDTGSKRSVTRGDLLSAVIEFDSTAGNVNIAGLSSTTYLGNTSFYSAQFTASWAKLLTRCPSMALKYNDGTYPFVGADHFPISGALPLTTQFHSGSTPDERGVIFQFPFSCAVGGAWFICDVDNVAELVLYDSDETTALATCPLDPDVRSGGAAALSFARFTSDITLLANTNYRLVLKPTSGSNIGIREFTVNTAAIMDGFELGQNMRHTARVNAGTWTEDTVRRAFMGLLVTKLDDGAGGGGGTLKAPLLNGVLEA